MFGYIDFIRSKGVGNVGVTSGVYILGPVRSPVRSTPSLPTPPRDVVALLEVGSLAVREDRSEAWLGGAPLVVTFAQRCVLAVLVRHGGKVARREALYEEAFGRPLPRGSRAVDIHVGRIRRALGSSGAAIVSVGRVGYRLDPDVL